MEQGLNKYKTKAIYGVAIIMMIYHHLFSLPGRLDYNYVPVLFINGVNVEEIIAWFCKICVAMYAFITGYGLIKTADKYKKVNPAGRLVNDYKIIIKQAVKFFMKFWLVCLFFLPIKFQIIGHKFESEEFITNLMGINCSYNGEWWYVFQYIKMLLIFPIVDVILHLACQKSNKTLKILSIAAGIGASIALIRVPILSTGIVKTYEFLGPYTIIFLVGIIFAKGDIFLKIKHWLDEKQYSRKLFALLLLEAVIYTRMKATTTVIDASLDFILVPFFILALELLINAKSTLGKTLIEFGKKSTFIWLLHTFICYYFFKDFILAARFSPIIFVEVTLISYLCAAIIDKLYRIIRYISLIKVRLYVKPIIIMSKLNQIIQVADTVEGKIRIEK